MISQKFSELAFSTASDISRNLSRCSLVQWIYISRSFSPPGVRFHFGKCSSSLDPRTISPPCAISRNRSRAAMMTHRRCVRGTFWMVRVARYGTDRHERTPPHVTSQKASALESSLALSLGFPGNDRARARKQETDIPSCTILLLSTVRSADVGISTAPPTKTLSVPARNSDVNHLSLPTK